MAGVSVEKRGNKWRYRFDTVSLDGVRKRTSKGGFDSEKEAMQAGVEALAKYNACGSVMTPSEISYGDYLDEWMDKYCRNNLKPETLVNYEKRIKLHIKPMLAQYKLKSLTPAILQQLINKKFQEGYSRNTIATIRGILSASISYAVEPMHYIDKNPVVYVRMPPTRAKSEVPTRTDPHVYITEEQINMILNRFPEGTTAHIPLLFGYKCGLRIGEAFAVCWEDIDFDAKKMTIRRQMQWDKPSQLWYITNPKYESERVIDIDEELNNLLIRTKEHQEKAKIFYGNNYISLYESDKGLVNQDGDGVPINLVNVRDNGELINPRIIQHTSSVIHHELKFPEFDFHSLRHTHTSIMLAAGAPIKYVQQRLGHKRPDVTLKVYQHITEKMEDVGASILNDIFKA